MRYFDKISLSKKIANISLERNKKTWQLRGTIPPTWTLIAPYLGFIFTGIVEDVNCKDVLKVFANADEKTLDHVSRLLAFWFFWSLERLAGYKNILQDSQMKEYFLKIWSLNNNEFQKLIKLFDDEKQERKVILLWELICSELRVQNLFPLFAFQYIEDGS